MSEQKHTQTIKGTITKVSSANTIKVTTKITKVHPLYRKRYSQNRTYTAHDPLGTSEVGQEVVIASCRPISKNKSWIIQ